VITPEAIWTELSLHVDPGTSEALAELLQDATGSGVTIEPPIKALGPDEGYTLNEGAPLIVRAYIYGAVDANSRSAMRRRIGRAGLSGGVRGRIEWRTLREEDWANAWKDHYHVEHVGRVVIRPAWREYTPKRNEVVVTLDPGMAFGTGQHPTTRMCLLALQDLMKPGENVLDLGCGSGVLAIAAVHLGCGDDVLAIDTEEQAVAATYSNAALNDMTGRIKVRHGSIDKVGTDGPYDVMMANINAATVTALAADIARCLKPGGWVAAGGIIVERQERPLEALQAAGLTIEKRYEEGDWRTFVCRKPA
jgi:ribosomal protein L11 methyltransferase